MCCKQSVVTARRIRRIMTPIGFTTRQITSAYQVHEPKQGNQARALAQHRNAADGRAMPSDAAGLRDQARPLFASSALMRLKSEMSRA
jgi:hypothetical protein